MEKQARQPLPDLPAGGWAWRRQAEGFRLAAGADNELEIRQFVEHLTRPERILIVLKRELYEGNWDHMVADLKARLEGRPYVFKLVHRIQDDLERIAWLQAFEAQHGVDLSQYVPM